MRYKIKDVAADNLFSSVQYSMKNSTMDNPLTVYHWEKLRGLLLPCAHKKEKGDGKKADKEQGEVQEVLQPDNNA